MSEKFEALTEKHIEFIKKQHIFFVGTAASEGSVNISPKGMDSFRVMNNSKPLILRLYGQAKTFHSQDSGWPDKAKLFPEYTGARQIFEVSVELVQTSCGYAVPFYSLDGERPTLKKWADNRGRDGIKEYWKEKNTKSLDGNDTGILKK